MPELPEVETVMRGLAPELEKQTIIKAEVRRPDLRWPFPQHLEESLTDQKVLRLHRRSKYLLIDLVSTQTLLVHLGMSGRMRVFHPSDASLATDVQPYKKHDHVHLYLSSGTQIIYNDARRFGAMDLIRTDEIHQHRLLQHLGPEPFDAEFSESYLVKKLKGKSASIKSALLDQRTVAGLGNIYVCEVLFRAGIHPSRKAGRISKTGTAQLVPIIRQVLQDAIDAGGSSLRDFRHTDGNLGYFQRSFDVYGREGMDCFTCGSQISRIVQAGRSSFFCRSCQV
ncbi:MAG: bifunctional DNA-formamidopyrimidine glycosylase/DNA-(apurinic or apyrimidinic site) lyase [Aestuariivita sp.]|nr:bifunctional DNA-formamidopyrimidine glycosylase/DNA-(apurinic or apyrimidinic site) lyase [Aestuariivita sp.]MCY4345682.1 bifunctional DNA-formamidopyrimidine glycosylase/DNA-(apurinic or apyrimidinic site) lyase [Aestuariivita sp.]